MAPKYMNEKYRYAFGHFAVLTMPEFVEDYGGFVKAVYHALDHVRNTPRGKDLLGAFNFLLDGKFSDAEISWAWQREGPGRMYEPAFLVREFLEACRTYLITGKTELVHPYWQPGGLLDN